MQNRIIIERILGLIALDNDVYREIFCRSLCLAAGLVGLSMTGAELYLRGLTYRRLSNNGKIYIGRHVVFAGRNKIELGENVSLYGFDYLNAEGERGYIRIGERSHVDQFCVLYGQGGLEIGRFCAIASGVKIYSQSNQYKHSKNERIIDQPVVFKKVILGDDVWVGANAAILPGVQIEEGAIVGAGAVVTRNVSSYSIVAGVPAKIIGWRKPRT